MPYEELPIIKVPLSDIRLDLQNYRIANGVTSEPEALAYLFASEDVIGTAKEILQLGYFDNEVPTVVREPDGSIVVLEGNRRVSALKGLQDPTIVPQYEAALRGLTKRYALETSNLPTSIRVILAPSREAAGPHIARLHIGDNKKRWTPDQQATFFYAQLSDVVTPEDIKQRHPTENITKYMKMGSIRRFLKGAKFTDHSLHDYVASNDLKVSILEYAYRHKIVCQLIGVEFAKNGLIQPVSSDPSIIASKLPRHQLATLEHLVEKFRSDKLNTRSAALKSSNKAEFERFIAELQTVHDSNLDSSSANGQAPSSPGSNGPAGEKDTSGAHGGHADSQSDSSGNSSGQNATNAKQQSEPGSPKEPTGASGGQQSSGARGPNHPQTRTALPLDGIDYTTEIPINLQYRYHELKSMDYKKHPLATALLLRSILETTIKFHFTRDGHEVTGELKFVMKHVQSCYKSEPKRMIQPINKVMDGEKPGSVTWFNAAAHHPDSTVNGEEVLAAWRAVSPLLGFLLQSRVPGSWSMPEPPTRKR